MPNTDINVSNDDNLPFECHFELPPNICAELKGRVTATFHEKGGLTPVNIIQYNQDSEVHIEIEFGGSLAHLFCLTWCVCVAFESCGQGPEDQICIENIQWDPCEGKPTRVTVNIPAGTLKPGKCGGVYHLCVVVTAKDQCGHQAPIAAMCKGPCVMVYDVNREF